MIDLQSTWFLVVGILFAVAVAGAFAAIPIWACFLGGAQ